MKTLALVSMALLLVMADSHAQSGNDETPREKELHRKYDELCAIWRKTDKVEKPSLSPADLSIVRHWLAHEPKIWYSHDFPRMAALTLGNVRDRQSYENLERLYLDTSRDPARYKMVRAEAFRAIAKIDPDRAAKYVIKELSSDDHSFAVYADIVLKEAYGTSFQEMVNKMEKAFKRSFSNRPTDSFR